jgi:potassium/hydrogen antiporter
LNTAVIVLLAGIFIFLAHLFAGLFTRTRVPDVLLLILLGIVVGPVLGVVKPEHFGVVGVFLTTITLVIMLFEGGLDLELKIINQSMKQTAVLTGISFVGTMVIVSAAAFALTQLKALQCLILGAAVGSTSPAVIVPLVRKIEMSARSRYVLFLEAAFSDVFSIVVALMLLDAAVVGRAAVGEMVGKMIASFVLAVMIGVSSGVFWSFLLNKVRNIPNAMFTTLAFVFVVFGLADILGYSGYIAALAFGVTLGNIALVNRETLRKYIDMDLPAFNEAEKGFFSEIVFLLKSFFFLYVGISFRFDQPWTLALGLLLTVLIFIIRFMVVRITLPPGTSLVDASLMSVMAPKGLAAVVLASLAMQHNLAGGATIRDITYSIVLFSIIGTSALVFLLEWKPGWVGFDRVYPASARAAPADPTKKGKPGPV